MHARSDWLGVDPPGGQRTARACAGAGAGIHAERVTPAVSPSRAAAPRWLTALLLACIPCAAAPPPSYEPLPPDPEAITVFGRYQPSLESLAPPGVEIGDLAMRDGRLVVHVRANGDASASAFKRALRRSRWYRDVRREAVEPGALREGEFVLSVRPQP